MRVGMTLAAAGMVWIASAMMIGATLFDYEGSHHWVVPGVVCVVLALVCFFAQLVRETWTT